MSSIETGGGGGKHDGGKVRSKKASTRIDMTPMVDLGFLLITFFILATTLSKPSAMTLNMPDKTEQEKKTEPIKASKVMTAFLGKDNQVLYIAGKAANEDPELKTVGYGYPLRQAMLENLAKIGPDFVIVVKPTKLSTYKNVVDMMDELTIAKIKRYALVDELTPDEKTLLKDKGKLDI